MKRFLLIIAILISFQGFSQISHGGSPISSSNNTLNEVIPLHTTPILNLQQYINEDAVTDEHKDIAWRFGIEQFVNLNLNNSGLWETLANGDKVWRLKIKSPNAKTINLNYSAFNLPIGATFFVFNKNERLGSFTHENNKANGEFSTTLLKGETVILEYFEPSSVQGLGVIEVSSVIHGYRDVFSQMKAFGSSGSCNINAICDTTFWDNEIRSSVIYLTAGNSRLCSGALVNNTLQDGTPYVLTANHCGPSSNNIFMFNYQSPSCATNIDGITTQTISGCTVRANNGPSDFFLVEMSSIPPANYNVFYAGWSYVNTAPTSATGIHYPALDVKKISHDYDPLIESGYYSTGNDHWEVIDWNTGTTEGGSSGSPLFDQNHRIVGQLHGGNAACGNDAFDYYGKFSYSWETDPATNRQLKFWLDPTGIGTGTIDGYDPNGSNYTTDAVLLDVSGIDNFICGDSITPKITIRNHGSNNLTSLEVNYELDGGGFTLINWSGNLAPYAIDSVVLATTFISGGPHTFLVNTSNPNGTTDQNILNDTASVNFTSNDNPTISTLYLTTDDYGSETSWAIKNQAGQNILTGGGYSDVNGGEQFIESLCLSDSCYTFVIYDSFNDGFCCAFGNGEFQLVNSVGDTIAENYTFASDSLAFPFCSTTGIGDYSDDENNISIYPNPTKGLFTVNTQFKADFDIVIYDVVGKIVYQKLNESNNTLQIDLTHIRKGMYFISVMSENNKTVERLIVN